MGRCSVATPDPEIKYVALPSIEVKKDSSDLRPISATKPDSIIYITVYRDKPENVDHAPPDAPARPVIDMLASYRATVEDWNTERAYEETLIDSDTLGRATLRATVQYNKLTGLNFDYTPVQRQKVTVIPSRKRLDGYGLGTVTNINTTVGVGAKYGSFGLHIVGGYDYKSSAAVYGAGVMIIF